MRSRVLSGIILGVLSAGLAVAAGRGSAARHRPATEEPRETAMPGVMISKELQAPADPPLPIPSAPTPPVYGPQGTGLQSLTEESQFIGPQVWTSVEYLLWWPKQQPLIPLAAGNNAGFFPILGSPGTNVLIGDANVKTLNVPGGKITASFGNVNDATLEGNYFFLGTQNKFFTTQGFGPDVYRFIGIPIINAATNAEDFVPIRSFFGNGEVQAYTSTRVIGAEALASMNLYEIPTFRIQGLVGYRFFQANEGLLITSDVRSSVFVPFVGFVPSRSFSTDEVTTSNQFNGGTIGTRTLVRVGAFFFEWDSKVSLGNSSQVVQRFGQTDTTIDNPLPTTTSASGGVFVNATNAGRFVNNEFAVLPETAMKLGYNYGAARFFLGYSVLYLNKAVRPADQLDRTIDVGSVFTGLPSPLGRPSPAINVNDFWVQGLSFGLELRY